jgi:hypothetical protein
MLFLQLLFVGIFFRPPSKHVVAHVGDTGILPSKEGREASFHNTFMIWASYSIDQIHGSVGSEFEEAE